MNEVRIANVGGPHQVSAGAEQPIGLSELGTVTKQTRGSWLGFFLDGGVPPFCRELLPLLGPDQDQ